MLLYQSLDLNMYRIIKELTRQIRHHKHLSQAQDRTILYDLVSLIHSIHRMLIATYCFTGRAPAHDPFSTSAWDWSTYCWYGSFSASIWFCLSSNSLYFAIAGEKVANYVFLGTEMADAARDRAGWSAARLDQNWLYTRRYWFLRKNDKLVFVFLGMFFSKDDNAELKRFVDAFSGDWMVWDSLPCWRNWIHWLILEKAWRTW